MLALGTLAALWFHAYLMAAALAVGSAWMIRDALVARAHMIRQASLPPEALPAQREDAPLIRLPGALAEVAQETGVSGRLTTLTGQWAGQSVPADEVMGVRRREQETELPGIRLGERD